tara:strand:- start:185 stop:469 length:285 start_codon:yes stop_codon:yes gene_type:complete
MIEINLFLFGKPEWEMDLEKAKAKDFEDLGKGLNIWLTRVSKIITKLENNGWERSAGLYDLHFFKDTSMKKAKQELKELKIKEKEVSIHQWDEE